MTQQLLEKPTFKDAFLHRVGAKNVPYAAAWLFLYVLPPTLLVAAVLTSMALRYSPELAATLGTGAGQRNSWWFSTLIFNPAIESLLLAGMVRVGVKCGAGTLAVLIAAISLSALHSFSNVTWGFTVLSVFLLHSYCFVHTYRNGFWRAYVVITLAHCMHNAFVMTALAFR